jgi:hypothetical protein
VQIVGFVLELGAVMNSTARMRQSKQDSFDRAAKTDKDKDKDKAVDCQQLKQTGARSAGSSAACNDFIPTACLRNMRTWGGGAWHVYLDMGEERRPRTAWRGSGRSMTAC